MTNIRLCKVSKNNVSQIEVGQYKMSFRTKEKMPVLMPGTGTRQCSMSFGCEWECVTLYPVFWSVSHEVAAFSNNLTFYRLLDIINVAV